MGSTPHPLLELTPAFAVGVAGPAGVLLLSLVLPVVIFVPLERLFSVRPSRILRKQVWTDLGWYFINSLVPAFIIGLPVAFLAGALGRGDPFGLHAAVAALPFWPKLFAALFVNDLGCYWGHRAAHAIPFLWRFHEVHHSAEHLDWLTGTRGHPFDMVFIRLCGLAPVCLLGFAQPDGRSSGNLVPLITLIGMAWSFFIHSNVKVRLGPLEYLVASPIYHHWHHSRNEMRDLNLAGLFPILDFIFGTAWFPRHWPRSYGVSRKTPDHLAGQFIDPLKHLIVRSRKPVPRDPPVIRKIPSHEHQEAGFPED